jgi:hypothetical protein
MTRSHVLLHFSKVLLSNPRWERRLLKFLGLSGVMDDGVDEEEGRLDRWDHAGDGGLGCAEGAGLNTFLRSFFSFGS